MLKFRNRLLNFSNFVPPGVCFEGEGAGAGAGENEGGAGGAGGKKPITPPPSKFDEPPPKGQEVFSREYVEELRGENKSWRVKMATERTQREAAEAAVTQAKTDFEAKLAAANTDATEKITAAQKAADDRVIRAELRSVATKAGMIDLDGLKLADTAALKLKDDGTVDGAEALMTALKTAKPYLFGTGKGTSNTNEPPKPKDATKKSALEQTPAEFAQSMRDIDAGKLPA